MAEANAAALALLGVSALVGGVAIGRGIVAPELGVELAPKRDRNVADHAAAWLGASAAVYLGGKASLSLVDEYGLKNLGMGIGGVAALGLTIRFLRNMAE